MSRIAEELDNFIKNNDSGIFIEVEGRPQNLQAFYREYNTRYSPSSDDSTNGIIVLQPDANKWGLEFRLYMHKKPDCIEATRTKGYRDDYAYRINDKAVIQDLFDMGYRVGIN